MLVMVYASRQLLLITGRDAIMMVVTVVLKHVLLELILVAQRAIIVETPIE